MPNVGCKKDQSDACTDIDVSRISVSEDSKIIKI